VALYAIRISKSPETDLLTYGWKRAEILAAFFNGIFLVALSVSIIIHAIQRFIHIEGESRGGEIDLSRGSLTLMIESAEVSEPLLVVMIGCVGLATNVAGIFIFHGKWAVNFDGSSPHVDNFPCRASAFGWRSQRVQSSPPS
jgi:zinc transporter 1